MKHDVIVVRDGPAGPAFTRGFADSGLELALVERQPLAALVDSAPDAAG